MGAIELLLYVYYGYDRGLLSNWRLVLSFAKLNTYSVVVSVQHVVATIAGVPFFPLSVARVCRLAMLEEGSFFVVPVLSSCGYELRLWMMMDND